MPYGKDGAWYDNMTTLDVPPPVDWTKVDLGPSPESSVLGAPTGIGQGTMPQVKGGETWEDAWHRHQQESAERGSGVDTNKLLDVISGALNATLPSKLVPGMAAPPRQGPQTDDYATGVNPYGAGSGPGNWIRNLFGLSNQISQGIPSSREPWAYKPTWGDAWQTELEQGYIVPPTGSLLNSQNRTERLGAQVRPTALDAAQDWQQNMGRQLLLQTGIDPNNEETRRYLNAQRGQTAAPVIPGLADNPELRLARSGVVSSSVSAPPSQGGVIPPATGGGEQPGSVTSIPTGQPFVFDANARVYYFSDGQGGVVPRTEAALQTILGAAGQRNGLPGIELWNSMVNIQTVAGQPIRFDHFNPAALDAIAAAVKKNPELAKPGVTSPGGNGTSTGASTQPYDPMYGAAYNTYFQKLARELGDGGYELAQKAGFRGSFKDWLIVKDQILHTGRSNFGGGGTGSATEPGAVVSPVATPIPTAVTEPNVRPFGAGSTVQFDQSDLEAVPENYRQLVDNLMRSLGYVSTGFLGRFGQQEYQRPANATPLTPELLARVTNDPRAQAWLNWLMYRKGLSGAITQFPVTPQ